MLNLRARNTGPSIMLVVTPESDRFIPPIHLSPMLRDECHAYTIFAQYFVYLILCIVLVSHNFIKHWIGDICHSPWSNENKMSYFLPGVGLTTRTSMLHPNPHESNKGSLKSDSPDTSRTHHRTRSHRKNTSSALPPTSGHMTRCRDGRLDQTV